MIRDDPPRRIPFSICDYAFAYVREKPWRATFAQLVMAQIKSKEAA
jgi:hypothetical protein